MLHAVLFEPGNHLPLKHEGREPIDVPTSAPELLATPHSLLINELCRSPSTLLGSIQRLMRQALDLDTGTLKSSTSTIILFVTRLACRIDNYVSMILALADGEHETLSVSSRNPARPVEISKEQCRELREARDVLHKFLWVDVHGVLRRWHLKLVKECVEKNDEETLDRNTRHLCNIMAHMLLCVRNARAQELDSTKVALVVRGIVFLSTRHQWNHDLLVESGDNGTSRPTWDGFRIPETEIYETVQVLRRKLVGWLRSAPPSELNNTMDAVLRASASNGALTRGADELAYQWAYVAGAASRGRFAQTAVAVSRRRSRRRLRRRRK